MSHTSCVEDVLKLVLIDLKEDALVVIFQNLENLVLSNKYKYSLL